MPGNPFLLSLLGLLRAGWGVLVLGAAERLLGRFVRTLVLGGCWGAGGALYFSKPVTFVTFGAVGLLGSWRGPFISSLLMLLGAAGGLELLGSWGLFVSHNPSPFVTFGAGGLLGSWRGPFTSQSPSLLSFLVLGVVGELLDSWKVLCFSEPVTFVTFAAGGATGGLLQSWRGALTFVTFGAGGLLGSCWITGKFFVSQSPSLLSLLLLLGAAGELGALCFCHFWGLLGCWGAGGPLFLS